MWKQKFQLWLMMVSGLPWWTIEERTRHSKTYIGDGNNWGRGWFSVGTISNRFVLYRILMNSLGGKNSHGSGPELCGSIGTFPATPLLHGWYCVRPWRRWAGWRNGGDIVWLMRAVMGAPINWIAFVFWVLGGKISIAAAENSHGLWHSSSVYGGRVKQSAKSKTSAQNTSGWS